MTVQYRDIAFNFNHIRQMAPIAQEQAAITLGSAPSSPVRFVICCEVLKLLVVNGFTVV